MSYAIDATHPRFRRYFNCTQSVAGVQDTRFQALMPDVLHWLGITKIHNFISMSDMKCVVRVFTLPARRRRVPYHAGTTPSSRAAAGRIRHRLRTAASSGATDVDRTRNSKKPRQAHLQAPANKTPSSSLTGVTMNSGERQFPSSFPD